MLFRNLSAIVGERLAHSQGLKHMMYDELTGAVIRPHFDGLLGFAVDRAERFNEPLSLIVLSIDGFDILQKEYGHRVGDSVLKTLTEEISRQTRRVDVFARWAGDKFALLLPQTTLEAANRVAEKLQNIVHSAEFSNMGELNISISLTQLNEGEDLEGLLTRAEEALIRAKNADTEGLIVTSR